MYVCIPTNPETTSKIGDHLINKEACIYKFDSKNSTLPIYLKLCPQFTTDTGKY